MTVTEMEPSRCKISTLTVRSYITWMNSAPTNRGHTCIMTCIQYKPMPLPHAVLTPCAAYGCPNLSLPIPCPGDQKIDFEEFKCLAALLPKRDHAIYRGALSCDPIVVPKARPGEEAKMTPVQRDRLEAQEKTKQALNEALARLRVKMRLNDDKMLLKVCG